MRLAVTQTLCGALLAAATAAFCAASTKLPEWAPLNPADLAPGRPLIEAAAPAEVLSWRLDIDDSLYPDERRVVEYVRYKIFDPSRVESLTRIGEINLGDGAGPEFRARVISPDGTIRTFGKEAVLRRPVARTLTKHGFLERIFGGDPGVGEERLLDVGAFAPGDILEIQIAATRALPGLSGPIGCWVCQKAEIPVRRFDWTFVPPKPRSGLVCRAFVVNAEGNGDVERHFDQAAWVETFAGRNVPSLPREAASGSVFDYALALMTTYEKPNEDIAPRSKLRKSVHVDATRDGPWARLAAYSWLVELDRTVPTKRVDALAAEIVRGASSPLDKARRIHDRVASMFRDYVACNRDKHYGFFPVSPRSLDDVLAWKDHPGKTLLNGQEFLWLDIALLKAAGLDAHTVTLPDRRRMLFNPRLVSPVFLADSCAGIRIDGQWCYSSPSSAVPLPFGMLPWYNQGIAGLVAHDGREEFAGVPMTPAAESTIERTWTLRLTDACDLEGSCRMRATGQPAFELRRLLQDQTAADRLKAMKAWIGRDLEAGTIEVRSVEGLDGGPAPLDVVFSVSVPAYAIHSKRRLLLPPSPFHGGDDSVFSSPTRRTAVQFNYPVEEGDRLELELPGACLPGSLPAPAAIDSAEGLFYRLGAELAPGGRRLDVFRRVAIRRAYFPPASYSEVKKWFDAVEDNDRQQFVLPEKVESPR
jgi:hypothetical protein